jgi:predicted ATP-grasp superfamily ATP-dependent carboligase
MKTSGTRVLSGRRVLVTDGEQRAALAVVRSLGAAGASPYVTSSSGASLAGASRFAAADIRIADPLEHPDAFVEGLLELVQRHSIDCLLPVTESALRPALKSSHLFRNVVLPFPAQDTFAAASDKRRVMEMAAGLSVPVPHQTVLTSPGVTELRSGRPDGGPSFPLVLKPAVSVADDDGTPIKLSVRHVADRAQLEGALADLPRAAFPLLVQERIVGPGIGIFLLRWEGRILARFAHRRLREKPPSGGVSVYRESITPPADALAYAEALLEALDWRGVAMVEFKRDGETGSPCLMEINGRFWGSLQLAIDAGVDFPRLLVEAAFGHAPAQPVEGRPGIRLRWLLGDLDHLLLRLRKSHDDLALGPDAPGRLRTLASFLVPWRPGDRWEVLRPSDPRPFGRELRRWIADGLSSGGGGSRVAQRAVL